MLGLPLGHRGQSLADLEGQPSRVGDPGRRCAAAARTRSWTSGAMLIASFGEGCPRGMAQLYYRGRTRGKPVRSLPLNAREARVGSDDARRIRTCSLPPASTICT
jgi:hypothetical protein